MDLPLPLILVLVLVSLTPAAAEPAWGAVGASIAGAWLLCALVARFGSDRAWNRWHDRLRWLAISPGIIGPIMNWWPATSWLLVGCTPALMGLMGWWMAQAGRLARQTRDVDPPPLRGQIRWSCGQWLRDSGLMLGLLLLLDGVEAIASGVVAIGAAPGDVELVAGLLLLTLILATPLLVRRFLRAQRLSTNDDLQIWARRAAASVGLPPPVLYEVPDRARGGFYNALVLGPWPGTRSVLIGKALRSSLDEPSQRAVIAHELGHLRYRHLIWYPVFLLMMAAWVPPLDRAFGSWIGDPAVLVALWYALGLGLLFGGLSRACERQADLNGAELAGPAAMRSALLGITAATGTSATRFNWRHGSIASRCHFLEQVHLDPGLGAWHHRHVMHLRWLIIIALFTALAVNLYLANQTVELAELRVEDPELDLMLDRAEAGEPADLSAHLLSLEPVQRQMLAKSILQHLSSWTEMEVYQKKGLLLPFHAISTESRGLDIELDNALAYTLVAGTTDPTARDMEIARSLLERLEPVIKDLGSPFPFLDTIGCVYYRLQDYGTALEYFRRAQANLPDADDLTEKLAKELAGFRPLLQRRIEAAQAAATGGEPPPLPVVDSVARQANQQIDDSANEGQAKESP